MPTENCKYVALLEDGSYIYSIEAIDRVLTCKSKMRARQFNQTEADKLVRAIKCKMITATWEHIGP